MSVPRSTLDIHLRVSVTACGVDPENPQQLPGAAGEPALRVLELLGVECTLRGVFSALQRRSLYPSILQLQRQGIQHLLTSGGTVCAVPLAPDTWPSTMDSTRLEFKARTNPCPKLLLGWGFITATETKLNALNNPGWTTAIC